MRAALYVPAVQVLKDSGVFEYTWTELELWLDQLARADQNQQETIIQFLERVSSSTQHPLLMLNLSVYCNQTDS